jgi:hypothetical protein
MTRFGLIQAVLMTLETVISLGPVYLFLLGTFAVVLFLWYAWPRLTGRDRGQVTTREYALIAFVIVLLSMPVLPRWLSSGRSEAPESGGRMRRSRPANLLVLGAAGHNQRAGALFLGPPPQAPSCRLRSCSTAWSAAGISAHRDVLRSGGLCRWGEHKLA